MSSLVIGGSKPQWFYSVNNKKPYRFIIYLLLCTLSFHRIVKMAIGTTIRANRVIRIAYATKMIISLTLCNSDWNPIILALYQGHELPMLISGQITAQMLYFLRIDDAVLA